METLKNTANVHIYPETHIRNIVSARDDNLQVETTRGGITNVSCVILATGYKFNLHRYKFLTELVVQHRIPLVCGLPCLDVDLQLHPIQNLFGSGTITQLQIGPAAGNIAGARLAYERFREKLLAHIPQTK